MAEMSKYCKAYYIKELRAFDGWAEKAENARPEETDNGETVARTLTDDDFLYLQENYVVTDGIFKDENIIFDGVTPDWIEYCQTTLEFEIPEYADRERDD